MAAQNSQSTAPAAEPPRQTAREADAAYGGALVSASVLLADSVAETLTVDFAAAEALAQNIYNMALKYDNSLLMESMLLNPSSQPYYPRHAINTAFLSAVIGILVGISGGGMRSLVEAGLLMDVGMLGMPKQLLDRTYQMNKNERVRMRRHTQAAVYILGRSGVTDTTLIHTVLNHHERFNGSGYPLGLTGEAIMLEARIAAVADSFDAAITPKTFSSVKTPFEILAELSENRNNALDPSITRATVMVIAGMLTGLSVILSDNSVAKIVEIHPKNLAFPKVRVVGRTLQTDARLYPVAFTRTLHMA